MKKECDIVQDLLFSYNDGILSDTSKEFVENHVKTCDNCSKKLKEIQEDTIKNNVQKEQIDYLKKIRKKLNKKTICFIIAIILLIALIVINILVFTKYNKIANKIQVYLEDNITQEQMSNIEQIVKKIDSKAKIIYSSKENELEKMKQKFKDNNNLLSGYEGENNIFPASYVIETKINKIDEIEKNLEALSGIKNITTNKEINPYIMYFLSLFTGQDLYN